MSLTPVIALESAINLELQFAVVGLWLGVVFLLAAWLYRLNPTYSEAVRKVVHIGTGNVILLAWWLDIPAWVGISASIVFSAIAFLSYYFPILPGINGVGRQSWGTFFYAVSIGLLIAAFWPLQQPQFAALGILTMTWGDGLAALVGQRFGKHPYRVWGMQKSWEGSATMFGISYLVCWLIFWAVYGSLWQTWLIPVGVALVATVLEAFSKLGIDNLTVPIGSAACAFLLYNWLHFI
ncbi:MULTISPECIES: diacylglycerol/polyprenol kinase family protein [Desertifilum]|uniref:diacylglycerol/polyprenol kinase family protein n=1 Tax=Desertifilum TaxID=1185872 RepID=UPI0018F04543|nr:MULTISPECIES: diacylglycerol/polyprenol kinase family protein [Desertifilum]